MRQLPWRTITIADGDPAVGFARLGGNRVSGSFCALVRFPPGWSRPFAGHYSVEEEMFVLDGELTMSGATYVSGDYADFPPGYLRSRSETQPGALAIAFFDGPADWLRVAPPSVTNPILPVASREIEPRVCPTAESARLLHEDAKGSTWLVDNSLVVGAPRDMRLEVVSLSELRWMAVEPGAPIPEFARPLLCRLRRSPR